MLEKPIKRMLRKAGGGITLTVPRKTGFKVEDIVIIEQPDERTLVLRNTGV